MTNSENQLTRFDNAADTLASEYGVVTYQVWCEREAARSNAAGRPAYVAYSANKKQCAVFHGTAPQEQIFHDGCVHS